MSKEIDIQVGDRVTFKNRLEIIIYANNMKDGWKKEEIIKVERIGQNGWYIVYIVEEKKELLTDEERKFLQGFVDTWKIKNVKIKSIWKFLCNNGANEYISFVFDDEDIEYMNLPQFYRNNNFKGMTFNKQYTLSELGLEE